MTDAPNATPEASRRFRSPPYPYIPLKKAVERASSLYEKARHHPVGFNVLADAWKYGTKSSGLLQTAAALIHFGLLTDEGVGSARKFKLTNDALRIIQDQDPNSEKRREALQRAAFKPKIHAELAEKFGHLSGISDVVLVNYLTLDRRDDGQAPFSQEAASELITEYKDTMSFAGVTGSVTIPASDPDKNGGDVVEKPGTDPEPDPQRFRPPTPPTGKVVPLMENERVLTTGLLSKGTSFRLIVNGVVGVKEIERLIRKLEFDKEILADIEEDEFQQRIAEGERPPEYGERPSISLLITHEQRQELLGMGYSPEDIRTMSPETAHRLLGRR